MGLGRRVGDPKPRVCALCLEPTDASAHKLLWVCSRCCPNGEPPAGWRETIRANAKPYDGVVNLPPICQGAGDRSPSGSTQLTLAGM